MKNNIMFPRDKHASARTSLGAPSDNATNPVWFADGRAVGEFSGRARSGVQSGFPILYSSSAIVVVFGL